jgi:hypothetical protein
MTPENEILRELRQISKISLLANAKAIETELGKLANTNDKKKMWVLIDGKRRVKDIAKDGNVSERAVNYFIAAARAAGLINYKEREPPIKLLEYSPPSWIMLTLEKVASAVETVVKEAPQVTLENLEQQISPNKTEGVEKNG